MNTFSSWSLTYLQYDWSRLTAVWQKSVDGKKNWPKQTKQIRNTVMRRATQNGIKEYSMIHTLEYSRALFWLSVDVGEGVGDEPRGYSEKKTSLIGTRPRQRAPRHC